MSNIALVLLAAGGSTQTESLPRAVKIALASGCEPVLVVVGSHVEETRAALDGLDVLIVENTEWEQGVGTSIRAGVSGAEIMGCEGVVLASADQPGVTAETLKRLIEEHSETGRPIIASEYSGSVGVPAFFTRQLFGNLKSLHPAEHCNGVILAHLEQSIRIACPELEGDNDTAQDSRAVTG